MKGDFFNLLEKFIVKNFGDVAFEKVYINASPNFSHRGPFLGTEIYPDSDFTSLFVAAISYMGISLENAQFEFGRFCFPVLFEKLPANSRNFANAKQFLLSIHSTIHVEVKKLHPKARPPAFDYIDPAPDELIMIYRSPRKMFWLVEGLIAGCAEHFKQKIEIARRILDEGKSCEYHLKFK